MNGLFEGIVESIVPGFDVCIVHAPLFRKKDGTWINLHTMRKAERVFSFEPMGDWRASAWMDLAVKLERP